MTFAIRAGFTIRHWRTMPAPHTKSSKIFRPIYGVTPATMIVSDDMLLFYFMCGSEWRWDNLSSVRTFCHFIHFISNTSSASSIFFRYSCIGKNVRLSSSNDLDLQRKEEQDYVSGVLAFFGSKTPRQEN